MDRDTLLADLVNPAATWVVAVDSSGSMKDAAEEIEPAIDNILALARLGCHAVAVIAMPASPLSRIDESRPLVCLDRPCAIGASRVLKKMHYWPNGIGMESDAFLALLLEQPWVRSRPGPLRYFRLDDFVNAMAPANDSPPDFHRPLTRIGLITDTGRRMRRAQWPEPFDACFPLSDVKSWLTASSVQTLCAVRHAVLDEDFAGLVALLQEEPRARAHALLASLEAPGLGMFQALLPAATPEQAATALTVAAGLGRLDAFSPLLAKVSRRHARHRALRAAAFYDQLGSVEALLAAGNGPISDVLPFVEAVRNGHEQNIRALAARTRFSRQDFTLAELLRCTPPLANSTQAALMDAVVAAGLSDRVFRHLLCAAPGRDHAPEKALALFPHVSERTAHWALSRLAKSNRPHLRGTFQAHLLDRVVGKPVALHASRPARPVRL